MNTIPTNLIGYITYSLIVLAKLYLSASASTTHSQGTLRVGRVLASVIKKLESVLPDERTSHLLKFTSVIKNIKFWFYGETVLFENSNEPIIFSNTGSDKERSAKTLCVEGSTRNRGASSTDRDITYVSFLEEHSECIESDLEGILGIILEGIC